MPVELRQGYSAPMQIVKSGLVSIDLNVHHHGVRLLNLADLSELDVIAETGRKIRAVGISAEVAG